MTAGCNKVLAKPCLPQTLASAVKHVLLEGAPS
jgi:hypothetical protein